MTRDLSFHLEIRRGPQSEFGIEPKAIYYVENHNAQCGYGELALDFEMAARAILATYREPQIGNWMTPSARSGTPHLPAPSYGGSSHIWGPGPKAALDSSSIWPPQTLDAGGNVKI